MTAALGLAMRGRACRRLLVRANLRSDSSALARGSMARLSRFNSRVWSSSYATSAVESTNPVNAFMKKHPFFCGVAIACTKAAAADIQAADPCWSAWSRMHMTYCLKSLRPYRSSCATCY